MASKVALIGLGMAVTPHAKSLLDLKNRSPSRFEIYPVLSREPQAAPLLAGRLDAPKLERFLETVLSGREFDEWFLCGPLEMVETLRTRLVELGVDARHIHRELFHVGPAANTAPQRTTGTGATSTVTVILDGRATSFELASDGATKRAPAAMPPRVPCRSQPM